MSKKRFLKPIISTMLIVVLLCTFSISIFARTLVGGYDTNLSNSWQTPAYEITSGECYVKNYTIPANSGTLYMYLMKKNPNGTYTEDPRWMDASTNSGSIWYALTPGSYAIRFETSGSSGTWHVSGYIYDGFDN